MDLADGRLTVGGGPDDGLCIPGLAEHVLALEVDGDRLTATPAAVVEIDGTLVPAGVPRLVLPGEVLTLPGGAQLCAPAPAAADREAQATVAVLRELVGGDVACEKTRAATLTCLTGLDSGRVFLLDDEVELGRGEHVALRIRDRSVSRRHARVFREETTFWIEDLGSPNGVFVNGAKLKGAHALAGGDVVELGHSMLRFDDAAAEPEPPEAPEPPEVPEPPVKRKRCALLQRSEWALVSVGTAFAVAGVLAGCLLAGA